MTKRISNFIFRMCVVGCISGILLAAITACSDSQVEKSVTSGYKSNVPVDIIYEDFWGKIVRMDVGDNTICYVFRGSQRGGISCLKQ